MGGGVFEVGVLFKLRYEGIWNWSLDHVITQNINNGSSYPNFFLFLICINPAVIRVSFSIMTRAAISLIVLILI